MIDSSGEGGDGRQDGGIQNLMSCIGWYRLTQERVFTSLLVEEESRSPLFYLY